MTLRTMTLTVPLPAKPLNLNDRRYRYEHAALVRTWREAAGWWAKQHRLSTRSAIEPVEVWFEFGTTQPKRRRDPHNWYPTIKAVLDGFTDAAVWADDDSAHVRTYEPTFTDKVPPEHLRINLTWEIGDT